MSESLGYQFKTASIAPTGHQNAGNWICEFSASDIGIAEPKFRVNHVNVEGGPLGSTFKWGYNNARWETVFPGWDTSWDPNNPMKMMNGDTVFFWWNTNTGTAATVWLYFERETPL
jgi:hypothetical protein